MPTYEYACKSCGEHLDVVQSFTEDPLSVCPNCGGELKKVFGSIGIVFKGSGFYKNDSRNGSAGSKAPTPEAGASSTTDSGDKADKPDKADKSDKSDKADKSAKADKPASEGSKKEPAPAKGSDSSGTPAAPAPKSTPSSKAAAAS